MPSSFNASIQRTLQVFNCFLGKNLGHKNMLPIITIIILHSFDYSYEYMTSSSVELLKLIHSFLANVLILHF